MGKVDYSQIRLLSSNILISLKEEKEENFWEEKDVLYDVLNSSYKARDTYGIKKGDKIIVKDFIEVVDGVGMVDIENVIGVYEESKV